MNSWRRIYLVTISSVRPSVRIGSSPLRKAVTSAVNGHRYNNVNLSLRVKRNETRRNFSTHGPDKPDAAARDTAAERDLRILREQSQELSQDDAMEAWRCLLEAACVDGAPADVFFALGELHYNWGDLLELGRRAELGAEGAARAVVGEIKHLRKHAMRKRRETEGAAPARRAERSGTRHADEEFPADPENEVGPWGNHREAWEWYLKAADLGDSRAMMQLGNIMIENKTAVDADLAFEWYRKASTSGQPDALFQIARMHHEGPAGVSPTLGPIDSAVFEAWPQHFSQDQAFMESVLAATSNRVRKVFEGRHDFLVAMGIGVPINSPHAREMYEEACEAGSSSAAFFLGHCNHHGNPNLGIEPDGKRALQLLQKASEQGHAEAVFYLAQAYRSGSPEMCLPQDLAKFSQMVVQSAAKGSADAMFTAGAAYFHGEDSFPRDPRAAFQYYSAAAAQGHADGNYCLGVMYYTTGDLEAAFRCYQTAAEGGNMLAWRNLASMYALGEGVPRSEQMAKHIMTTLRDKIDEQEASESEKDAKNGSDPPRS